MLSSTNNTMNDCCVCYEPTKYLTICNHNICNNCTDLMTQNKILCPYCRRVRTDICPDCLDRNEICICCVKYLFRINKDKFVLRVKFWELTKEFFFHNKKLMNPINNVIDEFIYRMMDKNITESIKQDFREAVVNCIYDFLS